LDDGTYRKVRFLQCLTSSPATWQVKGQKRKFRGSKSRCFLLRNLKLTVAYDGTDFSGWQVSLDAPRSRAPGVRYWTVDRGNVLPQGSGALTQECMRWLQVATVATHSSIPVENLSKALNDTLPASIRVLLAEEVARSFMPRKFRTGEDFQYRMYRGRSALPFCGAYVWHYPFPLDEVRWRRPAGVVEGEMISRLLPRPDPGIALLKHWTSKKAALAKVRMQSQINSSV